MKRLVQLLLAALLAAAAVGAHAQRSFDAAELEALLAPIALYPDPLLQQILDASQHPQEIAAAAQWSRGNPQLSGDAALATVQGTSWAPSVKALIAYPEILQRMDESPQWLQDLGEAYAAYGGGLMDTVQTLRARAQASGYLQSNDQQYVYDQGGAIYVQPVYPNVVYVPYYNPYVVYGGLAWGAYRPPHWRPWTPHSHVITRFYAAPRLHPHPHGRPPRHEYTVQPYHRVPESQRQPFVHGGRLPYVQNVPKARPQPQPRARPAPSAHAPRAPFGRPYIAERGRGFGGASRGGSAGRGDSAPRAMQGPWRR